MRGMSGVHSKYGSQVWFTLSVIYFSFVRIHCLWITILFGPAVNYLGCACSCSLNCCLFELFALYVSPPPLSLDIRHVIALLKNKPNKNTQQNCMSGFGEKAVPTAAAASINTCAAGNC